MAKSRAQRKAEQRRRQAQRQRGGDGEVAAQHDTQVPESADVVEAELAERGAHLDELTGAPAEPEAPAPSRGETAPARTEPAAPPPEPAAEPEVAPDKITRRELKRQERERKQAAKESVERRRPRDEPVERGASAAGSSGSSLRASPSCAASSGRTARP